MYMIEEDKKREQEMANQPTPTSTQPVLTGYSPTGVEDTRQADEGSEGTYNPTGR